MLEGYEDDVGSRVARVLDAGRPVGHACRHRQPFALEQCANVCADLGVVVDDDGGGGEGFGHVGLLRQ